MYFKLMTNRRKNAIGYSISNWVFQIKNWGYFKQLGNEDLFSDFALPNSEISNIQLGILLPIG